MASDDRTSLSAGRISSWLIAATLAATLLHLFLSQLGAPPLTADSWTYRELSRTLFGDFYAITTWRAYHTATPYSTAFPPLYPALLALADPLGQFGIYSGYLLNFALFASFAALTEHTARQLGMPGLGLASAIAMLCFAPFVDEIAAVRSIPLALLLLAGQVHLLAVARDRPWTPAAIGGLAGAAVMTRFDLALPMALLLGLAFLWRGEWRRGAMAAVSLVACCIPWVAYSLAVHGKLFATDNSRVALSVDPQAFVTDFPAGPEVTLFEQPSLWFAKLGMRLPELAAALWQSASLSPIPALLAAVGAAALSLHWYRRRTDANLLPEPAWKLLRACALACLSLAGGWAALLATGYLDLRYFSPVLWLCQTGLLALVFAPAPGTEKLRAWAQAAVVVALLTGANVQLWQGGWMAPARPQAVLAGSGYFRPITSCLTQAGAKPQDTLLFLRNDDLAAWFGAATGQRTAMVPWNLARLDAGDFSRFMEDFNVRYVLFTDAGHPSMLTAKARLSAIPGCRGPIYRLLPALQE